jgi:LPXTG-site transpeptidase (sortase) family protein
MTITPPDTPTPDPAFPPEESSYDAESAANLIRQKVARIYAEEPGAEAEIAEAQVIEPRSKYQQFMYELNSSGKDLASIQTEWHNYYEQLSTEEKHQVWKEFYDSQSKVVHHATLIPTTPIVHPAENHSLVPVVMQPTQAVTPFTLSEHKNQVKHSDRPLSNPTENPKLKKARSTRQIQTAVRNKVTAGGKLQAKHHLQSLLFGLGMGVLVIIIFLFGFFNEVIISPFIQPSRVAAATPLIVSSNSVAPTSTPEVIIPKINVEIPVDYSETSTNEADIENDLEQGVVHYPTTSFPGQNGNAAFFGHSSNNIFNKGKYKFAFVLLHTLVDGDTFYLTYNDKVYVYKVINKYIVAPSDVSVLNPVAGQTATATLITCDPPGTSINRLIVVGQQISPDPSGNTQSTATTATTTTTAKPTSLPGNGPTLWTRFSHSTAGKATIILVLLTIFMIVVKWINRPKTYDQVTTTANNG